MMVNVSLRESGYEFLLDTVAYEAACREVGCDTPEDWGIEYQAAEWHDAASADPEDVPAGWPEHLPLWTGRPQR